MMYYKMYLRIIGFAACMMPMNTHGQHPDVLIGEYELPFNDAISIRQLKEELVNHAKAIALQNKYGTAVMKIENMIISESIGPGLEEKFWSVTETQSRGTWLCDIENPVFKSYTGVDGKAGLKVTVKGYATPSLNNQAQIQAAIRSCPEPTCDAFVFSESNMFHIFFQSASKGFLLVFAEDLTEKLVYGIGNGTDVISFEIQPNTPLIYPDPHSQTFYNNIAFTLPEGATSSQHLFRFLFMEHQPCLPSGLFEPNVCGSEEFRKWLIKLVVENELLALETIPVTVIK